jgi:L-asparaginase
MKTRPATSGSLACFFSQSDQKLSWQNPTIPPILRSQHSLMKIGFITTGGTIDKHYFDTKSDYEVGPPQITGILRDARVHFEFEVESILNKDSLDMTDEDRRLVRATIEASPYSRIVLTHGTDTMIQTAQVLDGIEGKTIVLTGSMLPARFRTTDASFNIGLAIGAVQALPAGVYIAMSGRILDPHRSRKNYAAGVFEEF